MIKNLPANAGDTGLIPGPVKSHMQLSLCATTVESMLYSLGAIITEPMHRN